MEQVQTHFVKVAVSNDDPSCWQYDSAERKRNIDQEDDKKFRENKQVMFLLISLYEGKVRVYSLKFHYIKHNFT